MADEILKNPPSCVKNFAEPTRTIEMYRTLYRDITTNGVDLQYNDRHALGELAVMMVEAEILRAQLYEDGNSDAMQVQGDRNMITKKNPARDALEKIRAPMLRLMKEFKMTPSSRKVIGGVSTGGSEADEEFNNF